MRVFRRKKKPPKLGEPNLTQWMTLPDGQVVPNTAVIFDPPVITSSNRMRLVARFWNEDGAEMPALYRDDEGNLSCTWNYLMLVAPDLIPAWQELYPQQ